MRRGLARFLAALAILGACPAAGSSSPLGAPDTASRAKVGAARTQPVGWTEVSIPPGGVAGARRVDVLVWYPARQGGATEPYRTIVPGLGPAGADLVLEIPASASRDAAPSRRVYPLVVLSHGYGNHPEWLSWIAEALAARGYVVAAPRHRDPPYVGAQSLIEPVVYRALDQAVVARGVAQALARKPTGAAPLADPRRLAVVGYSMGGLGALRASGAAFNPDGAPAKVSGARLNGQVEGGGDRDPLLPELDAVVLLAPWGGQKEISAFSATSLGKVRAPMLVFAGDKDATSGYADGVEAMFRCLGSDRRWLVTLAGAGHNIGLNAAPPQPRDPKIVGHFEDPAWPKAALHGAGLHFISAFLDRELKGSAWRDAFLDRRSLGATVGSAWADRISVQTATEVAACVAEVR
jgi:predicted dienelactone hydrolase